LSGALFQLKDVGFSLSGRQILARLDLDLAPGRVYALVGPNGSGKSSLLKLLARQVVPSQGRIAFLGRPIAGFGDREFAQHLAYLPQSPPPADGMTVEELVSLGRFPWHGAFGRFNAADAMKTREALERTSIGEMSGRMVESLSGGERQRAWLAMMLAQDTHCLLLDEPTSALDIAHQAGILALIREISRERSVGIVIVLHDINMAARYCDEILALKSGMLIARGDGRHIVESAVLEKIYGVPMGVLAHPRTGQPLSYVI